MEHAYQVDRGVEAYERIKREGGVAILDYGTPIVYALTPRHLQDKIPGITPGFGRADATDGRVWPYIFPLAATYWSQMGGAMQYIKDNGGKKGAKVAFLFYDNPAGREPIKLFERICEQEGYTCRTFAVPAPGHRDGRRRSSTSPDGCGPTGWSPTSSAARRRCPSRSSRRTASPWTG